MSNLQLIRAGNKFTAIPPADSWFKSKNICYCCYCKTKPAQTQIPDSEISHYKDFDFGEISDFYEY